MISQESGGGGGGGIKYIEPRSCSINRMSARKERGTYYVEKSSTDIIQEHEVSNDVLSEVGTRFLLLRAITFRAFPKRQDGQDLVA